jgi:hypothetical protein
MKGLLLVVVNLLYSTNALASPLNPPQQCYGSLCPADIAKETYACGAQLCTSKLAHEAPAQKTPPPPNAEMAGGLPPGLAHGQHPGQRNGEADRQLDEVCPRSTLGMGPTPVPRQRGGRGLQG